MKVSIGRSKKSISCSHVKIDYWDDGIDVELFEVDGKDGKNKLIQLPEDGKLVRVVSDQGSEIRKLEWRD